MTKPMLILKAIRPKQWSKNVLLFAGLFLSHTFTHGPSVMRALLGFVTFCLISGAVYLVNDIIDLPRDRMHPRKALRPIASGELKISTARWMAFYFAAAGVGLAYYLSWYFALTAVAYLLLMAGYVLGLKNQFLLDSLTIAIGFVIRAVAGVIVLRAGGAPYVQLTVWFVICVFFLALLLAFGKRRGELLVLEDTSLQFRPVLGVYSLSLIDAFIVVCTAGAVMAYALYCTTLASPWPMLSTLPFVLFGVFRYLHLIYNRREGEAPENTLMGDPIMLGTVAIWTVTVVIAKSMG